MTPNQQTDLTNWLKDTSQELPNSLDNLFIEDCLDELNTNTVSKVYLSDSENWTNRLSILDKFRKTNKLDFNFFEVLADSEKIMFIQTLLSRTPEGQAVMPFLNDKIKLPKVQFETDPRWPETLDHLLYREFTEALRIGKTLDEALKIINKIYILEKYVPNK